MNPRNASTRSPGAPPSHRHRPGLLPTFGLCLLLISLGLSGLIAQDTPPADSPVTPAPTPEAPPEPSPEPRADEDAKPSAPEDPPAQKDADTNDEKGEPGRPSTERSIYVPYEDLEAVFEQDGRGVFLPYREFLDLWNQLHLEKKKATEKPPADGVLAAANYTASVEGDDNQVLAIDATLQVESFKDDGWAVVPLIQAGLNIAEAETGDATLHLGAKGYELILPKKGSYEIKLKLYAKILRNSGRHEVVLNLPKAGVSKFEAELPEQGWEFDLRPGAAYSSEDLPDGSTKLAFFFGETERFDLSWQKQGEETQLTPLLFVESDLTANVIPGALQTSATLNYRILRAGVDEFVVSIPTGQEVLGVSGDNIKEWDIADENGTQQLTVRLHAAAKAGYSLGINLEEALDTLPTEFDVPQIVAADVVRQRGSVTLRHHGELELETVTSEGLTQQSLNVTPNAAPAGTANSTFGRFRYLTTPFAMTLAVKKAEPVVEVESWTRFSVEPDAARFITRFDYQVKRVGIFDTRIAIPADFEGVEATGGIVEDFSEATDDDGNRTLTVKFANRAQGNFSFTVTGRLVRANAEDDATVPVFSPLDVERHEGKVGLEIHTSLDPNTKDAGDLRQQDVSLLNGAGAQQLRQQVEAQPAQQAAMPAPTPGGIPGSGPLQIGFRYRGEAAPAVIGFTLKEPQVNAEVFTLVEVREQLIRYRWTIAYNVLYAGVDTFIFSLPASIEDDLRVDGAIIKEIDKDYTREGDDTDATPLPEGHKLWAVVLRDKRMGSYELNLSFDRPLSEAEITGGAPTPDGEEEAPKGQHFQIGLPEIAMVDVFREAGQIAVIKDDNLEILDAAATALEPIDPKELRGGLAREGVFLAYKYRRHPLSLDLEVSRNEFLPVPQAVVTYAALTSVVSSDEAVTTEVIYWVKNNAKQFFGVSLPEGGKMVSDIYVDGTPQQPMRRADEDVVLIRLPVGGDQTSQVFSVRFVFEIPSENPGDQLGWFGSVMVRPAVLTDAEVLQSHVNLFLPNDYVYRSFKSAMRLPVERRGWTNFRNAFDWILPSLGPQVNPGLEEQWTDPPSLPPSAQTGFDIQIPREGQMFELHRLDAPAEIKIGFRSKAFAWFWEALFCLASFVGGVWMIWRPVRWRFAYFAGVGLLPLVIAGAVSPAAASFWQAIALGAFLAAILWLVFGAFQSVRRCFGKCREQWGKLREDRAKKKKAKATALPEQNAETPGSGAESGDDNKEEPS